LNAVSSNSYTGSTICPTTKFCPHGADQELDCPAWADCTLTGNFEVKLKCTAGQYFKFSDGTCATCPTNHFCPTGSFAPIPCPAGYTGKSGSLTGKISVAEACDICPAKKYCPKFGMADNDELACPEGYICPEGTIFPRENACAPGYY